MRRSLMSTMAALVVLAGAALSTPALSVGAREALGGLTSADDAVTHDGGAVSICKGGSFPGCKDGRAFYCPPGGECTETPKAFIAPTRKDHVAPTGVVMDPGTRAPIKKIPRPGAPATGGVLKQQ